MDMSSQKILFQTHFCGFSVALKGVASLQTATHPKGPIQLLRTKPFRRLIIENDVLHRAICAFASTKGIHMLPGSSYWDEKNTAARV